MVIEQLVVISYLAKRNGAYLITRQQLELRQTLYHKYHRTGCQILEKRYN